MHDKNSILSLVKYLFIWTLRYDDVNIILALNKLKKKSFV